MRETLLLRQTQPDAGQYDWRFFNESEPNGRAGSGTLDELAVGFGKARLILLVPTEAVLLTRVELPIRQSAKLMQAVPYALEERLADDVDSLHFAAGSRQPDGSTPIAVTSHEQMQAWLAPFDDQGLQLDALLPDVLALPHHAGQLTLCQLKSGRLLARSGAASGFAAQPDMLPALLTEDAPPACRLYRQNEVESLNVSIPLAHSENITGLLAITSPSQVIAAHMNLLQGRYATQHGSNRWVQALRLPAALAASLLLLSTLIIALDNADQQQHLNGLYSKSEDVFKQAFPEQTRIVDMEHQARQALLSLRNGGAQGGLLPLLSESAEHLKTVSSLKLDGLQFRDGSLYLSLSGNDLQALETLRGAFAKDRQLKLDVLSAQAGTDGVQIRLKVDKV